MMSTSLQEANEKYINSRFYPILERKHRTLSEDELKKKLEFEQELGLFDNMREIQEELLQETKDIGVSLHTKQAAKKYFETIKQQIEKRVRYKNNKNKLDYKLIRRFLWTAFNNLHELDLKVITPDVLQLSNNLREMAKVYNDFIRKTKYPALAYDEVFLAKQSEYIYLKKNTKKIVNEIKQLKVTENYLEAILEKKKKTLKTSKTLPTYQKLLQEYKRINGTYTDTIYICSMLREKHAQNKKQMHSFEKKYTLEFNEYFQKTASVYEKVLVDILGAMAFELDKLLWEGAKKSLPIKILFEKAQINEEYNTKTYLKYYLESNDADKASDELQELLELYQYLDSLYMESILIVTNNVDDAIEFKRSIKSFNKAQNVISYTDEKLALKWAFQNSVKILVINESLQNMTLTKFLEYYKKYTLSQSELILLGNCEKLPYKISKKLAQGITPMFLAKQIQELIDKP